MLLEELLSVITKKTGKPVNQSMLADALGITRQTVSNRIKNESQVTVAEIKKIEKYYEINFFSDNNNNNVEFAGLNYYTDVFASCGDGNIIFSDEKIPISLPTFLIKDYSKKKKYSMINASGNSMSPTIENGDKLIVEHWNGEQIQDNKIYVFCFNNEFFVKRLSKNLDEIIIKSDNPDYRTRTISGSTLENLTLIGKIVGSVKTLI